MRTMNHHMKRVAIISLIVFSALVIGLFQQSRLVALQRESAGLIVDRGTSFESSLTGIASGSNLQKVGSSSVAGVAPKESMARLAALMLDMMKKSEARHVKVQNGERLAPEESDAGKNDLKELHHAFARLDASEVLELIRQLKVTPDLPDYISENPARICVKALLEVNPKLLLDVIPALGGYPNKEEEMDTAFYRWLRKSPHAAIKWYDDQAGKENPAMDVRRRLSTVILEEVKFRPEHALVRTLSLEKAGDLESMTNIGANMAWSLEEADENAAFFSALSHQMKESPNSVLLADMRRDYLGELRRRLNKWPFDSSIGMLDAGCTPSEKVFIAEDLYQGDLEDCDEWATWILKFPRPSEGEHPLLEFFSRWKAINPGAAAKWLKQAPSGELKDELMKGSVAK